MRTNKEILDKYKLTIKDNNEITFEEVASELMDIAVKEAKLEIYKQLDDLHSFNCLSTLNDKLTDLKFKLYNDL